MSKYPILYDFIPYKVPRKGLFSVYKKDGKYILGKGWENEIVELTIIGEDSTSYIEKLSKCEEGKWVGNKVIKEKYTLPLGVHKSRFVKWTTGQLRLFDNSIIEPI